MISTLCTSIHKTLEGTLVALGAETSTLHFLQKIKFTHQQKPRSHSTSGEYALWNCNFAESEETSNHKIQKDIPDKLGYLFEHITHTDESKH